MGGVLDLGTPKPTRDGFIRNFKSLRSHEKALNDMKQANSKNITQMEFHLAQINKDRGILLRQLTTDIWKEPNPKYVAKCQEKMDLEGRLYRITQDPRYISKIDENKIDLTFNGLYTEIKFW